jgi:hypothetical protein
MCKHEGWSDPATVKEQALLRSGNEAITKIQTVRVGFLYFNEKIKNLISERSERSPKLA